jgi:hypothetical protein
MGRFNEKYVDILYQFLVEHDVLKEFQQALKEEETQISLNMDVPMRRVITWAVTFIDRSYLLKGKHYGDWRVVHNLWAHYTEIEGIAEESIYSENI